MYSFWEVVRLYTILKKETHFATPGECEILETCSMCKSKMTSDKAKSAQTVSTGSTNALAGTTMTTAVTYATTAQANAKASTILAETNVTSHSLKADHVPEETQFEKHYQNINEYLHR